MVLISQRMIFFWHKRPSFDLLAAVELEQGRLVLILDQFDRFCQTASPELTMLLRALRDSFKETLSYLVGMRQAAMYMSEPEVLGELYQLLDTHVCWVGAMQQDDARLIDRARIWPIGSKGIDRGAREIA